MSDRPDFLDDTSTDDLIAIGSKIVEAAERVTNMHAVIPGARATWHFAIDDVRFKVEVTVAEWQLGPVDAEVPSP